MTGFKDRNPFFFFGHHIRLVMELKSRFTGGEKEYFLYDVALKQCSAKSLNRNYRYGYHFFIPSDTFAITFVHKNSIELVRAFID